MIKISRIKKGVFVSALQGLIGIWKTTFILDIFSWIDMMSGSATIVWRFSTLKASTTRIIISRKRGKKSLFACISSQLEKQMSQNNNKLSKTQKLCHSQLIVWIKRDKQQDTHTDTHKHTQTTRKQQICWKFFHQNRGSVFISLFECTKLEKSNTQIALHDQANSM